MTSVKIKTQQNFQKLVEDLLTFGNSVDYSKTITDWFLTQYSSEMLPECEKERGHLAVHYRALIDFFESAEQLLNEKKEVL